MNEEERYKLITRNLAEIIGEDDLKKVMKKKSAVVYWGTMPTGSPHVAYFLPLSKIGDFLKAGLKVKILIADLHAALDGVQWSILEKRQKYYEHLFPEMLKSIGINTKKLEFVKGSEIQKNPKYFEDVLKMSMISTINDTTRAASEVVKMHDNPKLGNLIYPIMQALDEEYLKADIQFGGIDQRKIMVFAREFLPKIGYKPRVELMNPMIAGLTGDKMSASHPTSKIDVLDDQKTVEKKVMSSEFSAGSTNNAVMQWIKYIIFPYLENKGKGFTIERDKKYGGNLNFSDYNNFESEVEKNNIHPFDIKKSLSRELNTILDPIRKNKVISKLYKEAYL